MLRFDACAGAGAATIRLPMRSTSAIGNNPQLMAERKARAGADENLNQANAQLGPQVNLTGIARL